jgi:alpha-galactosidase
MDASTKEILTNRDVIAVNQDKMGEQATKFMDMGEYEIWAKPMSDSTVAVCFMNRTNQPWKLDYDWKKQTMYFVKEVSVHKKVYNVYDLWAHKIIGKTDEQLKAEIPAHGVLMVRLSLAK